MRTQNRGPEPLESHILVRVKVGEGEIRTWDWLGEPPEQSEEQILNILRIWVRD